MPEGEKVRKMFAGIANRYDLANLLLSGGCCRYWAKKLVSLVAQESPVEIVDLATGSGDIAFELHQKIPSAHILAFDFCEEMLAIARSRAEKKSCGSTVEFSFGDCMSLPIADNFADAVTIAYGVRNFEDRARGLRELHRIIKPRGKVFILEFTQPTTLFRPIYYFYLKFILPLIARIVTGDKKAYDYLAGSIAVFPPKEKLSEELRAAGFSSVRVFGLTASVVAIHVAQK